MGVIYYTPSYTPSYIEIAIDRVDSIRHKKSLNPLSLSFLGHHEMLLEIILAVKEGFEPSIRYKRIHTFQACSLSHSDTSPRRVIITKKKIYAKQQLI